MADQAPKDASALLAALSDQHRLFAEAYVRRCGNAYRAALDAGYSESTADRNGYLLVRRPDIRAAIDALFDAARLSTTELLGILESHAHATIDPFLGDHGELDITTERARAALHTVKSVKSTISEDGASAQITLHDSQAAAALLLKIKGETGPDLEVTFKVVVPEPGKK